MNSRVSLVHMPTPNPSPPQIPTRAAPRRLEDRLRDACRIRHYSLRTEEAYWMWSRRFILFHGKRHPRVMGAPEITEFLTDLAVQRDVAPSTQMQAMNALVFLYEHVLGREAGEFAEGSTGVSHHKLTETSRVCRHAAPRASPTPR
jgi:hypothetical protein